ncbi:hypothetical protein DdX_13186 [Ditylenchus destructor]|uniref:Uncharacterized protein n=1 Tax=Ditylenchus destructor TaxID=166010 RepID=A0AAD4QZR2_9BILA|nr:hypothetical protein DdX_13186 [Ditylenchus destructor]
MSSAGLPMAGLVPGSMWGASGSAAATTTYSTSATATTSAKKPASTKKPTSAKKNTSTKKSATTSAQKPVLAQSIARARAVDCPKKPATLTPTLQPIKGPHSPHHSNILSCAGASARHPIPQLRHPPLECHPRTITGTKISGLPDFLSREEQTSQTSSSAKLFVQFVVVFVVTRVSSALRYSIWWLIEYFVLKPLLAPYYIVRRYYRKASNQNGQVKKPKQKSAQARKATPQTWTHTTINLSLARFSQLSSPAVWLSTIARDDASWQKLGDGAYGETYAAIFAIEELLKAWEAFQML